LDYNQLESEDIDFSVFPDLQHLDLFLNLFKAFPKLPDSLISLNIGFNYIRSISLHLPNLTELRLAGNELTEIGCECKFPKLRTLDLAMNRLVQIHPISSFAPELLFLNCSHNFLSHFPSGLPPSLVRLDVSHNILEDVNDELAELSTLESLDISWNHLRILPRLPISLLHFSAEMNLLSEATPMSMTQLNTLQLSSNQFTSIPEFNCSRAAILLMRFNKLTEIHTERISPVTKRIDLTRNEITDIPIQCYSLRALQSLNLSVNRIQLIRPEILNLRITSLSLNENAISDLPALPVTLMR
jgi:Leucine-rich repeat (LRR) protein